MVAASFDLDPMPAVLESTFDSAGAKTSNFRIFCFFSLRFFGRVGQHSWLWIQELHATELRGRWLLWASARHGGLAASTDQDTGNSRISPWDSADWGPNHFQNHYQFLRQSWIGGEGENGRVLAAATADVCIPCTMMLSFLSRLPTGSRTGYQLMRICWWIDGLSTPLWPGDGRSWFPTKPHVLQLSPGRNCWEQVRSGRIALSPIFFHETTAIG